jgi:hypothetical protein
MKKNKRYFSKEKPSIPSTNPVITAVSLFAALLMTAAAQITACPAAESQLEGSRFPIPDTMLTVVDPFLTKNLVDRAIYSKTYATVAASSFTYGSLSSGGATTLDTTGYVRGNLDSGAAITLSAGAIVKGFANATDPRTEERSYYFPH